MPGISKEKCICQICICGEHRCELLKCKEYKEKITKTVDKQLAFGETECVAKESEVIEENNCKQKEKCRKQWETSPDQIKEITRSLSQINGSHNDRKESLTTSKKAVKVNDNNTENRPLLPPINNLSDSDSGKEQTITCICDGLHRQSVGMDQCNNFYEYQWLVTRPKRNRPKDNLRMEGPMEMETTFKTTYDCTAKQINENLSKNVAIITPSSKQNSCENLLEKQKSNKTNHISGIRSSKKKSKHRPSTSLKAGGDGYFNTISKESYKNFVIVEDNNKAGKVRSSSNSKKSNVCCSTVAKLPKVDSNKDERERHKKQNKEVKASDIELINKSMHKMTTKDNIEVRQETERNRDQYIQTSTECPNTSGIGNENGKYESIGKTSELKSNLTEKATSSAPQEDVNSWTIGSLDEPKRVVTRDVDNIKELGILDVGNDTSHKSQQIKEQIIRQEFNNNLQNEIRNTSDHTNGTNRVRIESKHYVQQQSRQKKHKNDCSVKLFNGEMDFSTTNKTCFANKSQTKLLNSSESSNAQRLHTAGKRSRKNGRKPNLFRTSTESEFCQTIGDPFQETTYQNQFGDRLYCPALDLGSTKSDFKFRGESSGHKFFLPAVKY